jgi:hypothetical protein
MPDITTHQTALDVEPDETLSTVLRDYVYGLSTRALAISSVAGLVAILGAAVSLSLVSSLLAAAGGCQVALGLWGIAEQRLGSEASAPLEGRAATRWHAVRIGAVALGTGSALLLVNLFAFGFVGRLIS